MFVISDKVKQAYRNLCTIHWYQSLDVAISLCSSPRSVTHWACLNIMTLTWGSALHDHCTDYPPRNSCDVTKSQSGVLSLILILYKPDKKQRYLTFWLACSVPHQGTCTTVIKIWNSVNKCLFFYFYTHIKIRMLNKFLVKL